MNILQMTKKTLTIEKPCNYLFLTEIIRSKIKDIEFVKTCSILVLGKAYLAKLHSASRFGRARLAEVCK